ncbi:hypothetical protein ACL9RL_19075 [Plantibacter sp. Mn2098]|uniref:hypothetical protein n=1 Tax=Plantibacter sp. Mn2098 TaxID=3395266 RepID=UPI003BD32F63
MAPEQTSTPSPAPSSTTRPARIVARIGLEVLGVLVVAALALIAVAHVLSTERAAVFLSDGDSVILPIMLRSFTSGEAQLWSMSAVFFAFPEIPLYLLSRLIGHTPQLAFVVNGVLNVLAVYAALRLIVRAVALRTTPTLAPALRIAAAIVPISWLVLLVLLEHTMLRDSFELASLFLTTTYYSGSTLGLLFTIGLLGMTLGHGGAAGRDRIGWLIALGVLTALCIFSNPLYGVWAVAPAAATAFVVAVVRIVPWRRSLWAVGVLSVGTLAGLVLRMPFARYISANLDGYIRQNGWTVSSEYYGARIADTTTTAAGVVEIVLVIIAAVVTVGAAALAMMRRWHPATVTVLLASGITIVTTFFAMMLLGTEAARYFAPLWFAPIVALTVATAYAGVAVQRWWGAAAAAERRRRDTRVTVAAAIAVVALVGGVLAGGAVSVSRIGADPDVHRFAGAECLADWVGDQDLTGAGEFWTVRGLQAYGERNTHLLQIDANYHPYLWITNAADFTGQDVSYLVVDSQSAWFHSPDEELGQPAARIACGRFTILDYRGTPGEQRLTSLISDSATQQRAERGLDR